MAKLRSLNENNFAASTRSMDQSSTSNFQEVLEIPIEDIDLDLKKNIRDSYNAEALQELAKSIEKHGLLEPVGVVKNITGKYKLIYGFRRALAITKFTKINTIRAITVQDSNNLSIIQLLENIQREDLTDYEIAKTLSGIKKAMDCNLETLAREIDKSLSWVKKKMAHGNFIEEMEEESEPDQLKTLRSLTSDQAASISKLSSQDKKSALNLIQAGKGTVANLRDFSKDKKIEKATKKSNLKTAQSKPLSKAQIQRISEIKSKIAKLSADKIKIEKDIQKLEKELNGIGQ